MLKDNLKTLRKNKGLLQEELSVKLNVVRQTISKWETGLSVPDAEMLVKISNYFNIPVSTILGENIEEKEQNDLKVIAEKLEIINDQLATNQELKRKRIIKCLIITNIFLILLFILLAFLNSPYQNWDYEKLEYAILGTFYHSFEWVYFKVAPIIVIIISIIIIFLIKKDDK